jgi:hypothetical protein
VTPEQRKLLAAELGKRGDLAEAFKSSPKASKTKKRKRGPVPFAMTVRG